MRHGGLFSGHTGVPSSSTAGSAYGAPVIGGRPFSTKAEAPVAGEPSGKKVSCRRLAWYAIAIFSTAVPCSASRTAFSESLNFEKSQRLCFS